MPRVQVTFFADLNESDYEDLMSADPALLHEYVPELVERIVETSEVGIYELKDSDNVSR